MLRAAAVRSSSPRPGGGCLDRLSPQGATNLAAASARPRGPDHRKPRGAGRGRGRRVASALAGAAARPWRPSWHGRGRSWTATRWPPPLPRPPSPEQAWSPPLPCPAGVASATMLRRWPSPAPPPPRGRCCLTIARGSGCRPTVIVTAADSDRGQSPAASPVGCGRRQPWLPSRTMCGRESGARPPARAHPTAKSSPLSPDLPPIAGAFRSLFLKNLTNSQALLNSPVSWKAVANRRRKHDTTHTQTVVGP